MTENEMRKMQEEALRRTQEMQRRANAVRIASGDGVRVNADNSGPPRTQARPEDSQQPEQQPDTSHGQSAEKRHPDLETVLNVSERHDRKSEPPVTDKLSGHPSGGIFEVLFRDKEKTLILGLILLLMDEKTDNALLMALMYLLI